MYCAPELHLRPNSPVAGVFCFCSKRHLFLPNLLFIVVAQICIFADMNCPCMLLKQPCITK